MNKTATQSASATRYQPLRTSIDLCGDSITIHRRLPPLDLAPYVQEFWQYDVDPAADYVPVHVFPTGCVLLRFSVNNFGVEPVLYGPSVRNNMKGLFFHDWVTFGAALRPDMTYHLLGLAMNELRDLRINMECFWPIPVRDACEQIQGATSFDERIEIGAQFLRQIVRRDVKASNDFLNAFTDIVGNSTRADDISLIAKRYRTSGRSLRRHFSTYLGLGPKQMDRLVRVQRSMKRIQKNPKQSLVSLSANSGFSDQAHFSREFRAFAGYSPKMFASLVGHMHDKHLDTWSEMDPAYRYVPPVKVYRFE